MPDAPTFGRYTEIPYDRMTPEQQEGSRSLIETRGRLPGPTKIWVHNPQLAKVAGLCLRSQAPTRMVAAVVVSALQLFVVFQTSGSAALAQGVRAVTTIVGLYIAGIVISHFTLWRNALASAER